MVTEIMYDLPAGDAGHEWIEVYNDSDTEIDLTLWRFFEGEQGHLIKNASGNPPLPPQGIAIIADNEAQFRADWPSFSGSLFDSSFSLHNTGEELSFKDENGLVHGKITYASEWGGSGDGNSLSLFQGAWHGRSPSPGTFDKTSDDTSGTSQDQDGSHESSSSETIDPVAKPKKESQASFVVPNIYAEAHMNQRAVVGAQSEFTADVFGLQGEPIDNARFLWNFGDGSVQEGKRVYHAYEYPGSYVVVLSVSAGKYHVTDRGEIVAVSSPINVSNAVSMGNEGFIEVSNTGDFEIDISRWILSHEDRHYVFPKYSIIRARAETRFPLKTTLIALNQASPIVLSYPNGITASTYHFPILRTADHEGTVVPDVVRREVVSIESSNIQSGANIAPASLSQSASVAFTIPGESELSELSTSSDDGSRAEALIQTEIETNETSGNSLAWILAFTFIVVISVLGIIFIRREKQDEDNDITLLD